MATPPLPAAFVEQMHGLLDDALPTFLAGFDRPAVRGLRVNTAKTDRATLAQLLAVPPSAVGWAPTGLQLPPNPPRGLGDHLAHRAGLYYAQEPSAIAPAEVLAAALGDRLLGATVIDLAAAPGGKTTRLAELVGPAGLVVANEVDRARLAVLHENLDRWGCPNVVTTNRSLDQLAAVSPAAFDAALLDAPCSGEGMFRRDPATRMQWSLAGVRGSARRQRQLLRVAARLVRPGGVLVYSTCTFSAEENEQVVAALVAEEPAWTIEPATTSRSEPGFAAGIDLPGAATNRTARLWPHLLDGEGQFVAVLRRDSAASMPPPPAAASPPARRASQDSTSHDAVAAWRAFQADTITGEWGRAGVDVCTRRDRVLLAPATPPPLPDRLLARPGMPLGRARPGRFEPAQALAGLLGTHTCSTAVTWPDGDDRWSAYLDGAELAADGAGSGDGWVLVTAHGWGVGWARRRHGVLKNFLPRSLRRPIRR